MAIYVLQITPVSRSQGRNAPASAAYRAGERLRDARTGAVYDHRGRDDVLHKEIMLPSDLEESAAAEWARDRSTLWNEAERAERQSNSRVAREYMMALPSELPAGQRLVLARTFSREIADRYHVAVDLALHAPRPQGDSRNYHAHLLTTTRRITPEGLGAKTGLDMDEMVRAELGLLPSRKEFTAVRARWAELTNEALEGAHVIARVDHRSLEAQGIDREPRPHLPWAAIAAERRGERSEIAERIRARYQERVVARQARQEQRQQQPAPQREVPPARSGEDLAYQAAQDWRMKYGEKLARASSGLDEAHQAALNWKRYREQQAQAASGAGRDESQRARQEWLKYREGDAKDAPHRPVSGQEENTLQLEQTRRDRGHDYSL